MTQLQMIGISFLSLMALVIGIPVVFFHKRIAWGWIGSVCTAPLKNGNFAFASMATFLVITIIVSIAAAFNLPWPTMARAGGISGFVFVVALIGSALKDEFASRNKNAPVSTPKPIAVQIRNDVKGMAVLVVLAMASCVNSYVVDFTSHL